MLLARARAVRTPFVYAAIGLPERLARLGPARMERLYARRSEGPPRCSPTATSRPRRSGAGVASAASMSASSSCRSASTSRRSGRPAGRRTSTSSRSGPIRTATSSAGRRSPGRCPTRASSSSRRPIALRSLDDRPDNRRGRDRPAVRRDAPSARTRRASLRSPCVRTATPVRRRSCSRRWRSPSRSSSPGRRRSRPGTGSWTASNVRLAAPGDRAAFGRALIDLLTHDEHARVLGLEARRSVEVAFTWQRYVEQLRQALIRAAVGRPRAGGRLE